MLKHSCVACVPACTTVLKGSPATEEGPFFLHLPVAQMCCYLTQGAIGGNNYVIPATALEHRNGLVPFQFHGVQNGQT
eukprot:3786811-Amphidinium_carterae.1